METQPLTVDNIIPYLSERGIVELDSAIKSLRLVQAGARIQELEQAMQTETAGV